MILQTFHSQNVSLCQGRLSIEMYDERSRDGILKYHPDSGWQDFKIEIWEMCLVWNNILFADAVQESNDTVSI